MDFKEAKWDKKYNQNIYVKKINDEKGNIYGFYMVRMTQNGLDGKYIISPLVIMSDFKMQELNNYSRLKEYIDYFDEKKINS